MGTFRLHQVVESNHFQVILVHFLLHCSMGGVLSCHQSTDFLVWIEITVSHGPAPLSQSVAGRLFIPVGELKMLSLINGVNCLFKSKRRRRRINLLESQKQAGSCRNLRNKWNFWVRLFAAENITWLPGCAHWIMTVNHVCPTLLGSRWLIWRELSPPLLADVIIPSLYLPGELGDRCVLVCGGPVQPADIVAVFRGVVLQDSSFAAFLTPELQDGEDSSKFTDHPVLKPEHPEDSQPPHIWCCVSHTYDYCKALIHLNDRKNKAFILETGFYLTLFLIIVTQHFSVFISCLDKFYVMYISTALIPSVCHVMSYSPLCCSLHLLSPVLLLFHFPHMMLRYHLNSTIPADFSHCKYWSLPVVCKVLMWKIYKKRVIDSILPSIWKNGNVGKLEVNSRVVSTTTTLSGCTDGISAIVVGSRYYYNTVVFLSVFFNFQILNFSVSIK